MKIVHVQYYVLSAAGTEDEENTTPTSYSFFSIEYYQQYFNVDTNIVMERIMSSMIPRRAPSTYLKQNIGRNPDLYGPFWIVVTLVRQRVYFKVYDYNSFNFRYFVLPSAEMLQATCNKPARIIIGVTTSIWYLLQPPQSSCTFA